jgi:hypothetical protein
VDEIALAATLGGTAVGLAGIVVTAWGARQQRESAKELAELQHEHERGLARGARLFDHRAAVYEAMLGFLQAWWERIIDTEPIMRVAGTPDPPEAPGPDDWRPMYVRLRTFGSPEVAALYEEFTRRAQHFFIQAGLLRAAMNQRGLRNEPEPWQETQDARERVKGTFDRLQLRVSEELASL